MLNVSRQDSAIDYRFAFMVARAVDALNKYLEKEGGLSQEMKELFSELSHIFADSLAGLDFLFRKTSAVPNQLETFLFMREIVEAEQQAMDLQDLSEETLRQLFQTAKTTLEHFAKGNESQIPQPDLEKTKVFLQCVSSSLEEKAKFHMRLRSSDDAD